MGFIEDAFRLWYAKNAPHLDPDPDASEHKYEYRGAYMSGAKPDENAHWPSEWKQSDHQNRFVPIDGKLIDTITMKPAEWWAKKLAASRFGGE